MSKSKKEGRHIRCVSVLGSFGCETTKLNIDFMLLSDGQLGWFILDLMFEGAWLLVFPFHAKTQVQGQAQL